MIKSTPIINNFSEADQLEVKQFVLGIQNGEFNLSFLEEQQPDLTNIREFYVNGGFWVAKADNKIVGTIGLQRIDSRNGVLRKMFVDKDFRGQEFGTAQLLFNTLLKFAVYSKFKTIWLDTPAVAEASHKFYERNGFQLANKSNLPVGYAFLDNNSKVYKLQLAQLLPLPE